jgi:hypothetical protein
MMKRFAETSPRFKARLAGVFFLLVLLTSVFSEFVIRGRMGFAGGLAADLIEASCYIGVTLLFYVIFKPVSRSLALLAVTFNFVGLTLEALQWQPHGVVIGMVLHAFYCFLIGYLIFRSTFLPRILAVPMAVAGLCWLTLSPPLAHYLAPYNLALGLLGEASLCLWLLVMGVNNQRWKEQAGAP